MFQPFLVIFSKFNDQNYNYCIRIFVTNTQRSTTPEPQQQLCSEVRQALLSLQIVVHFCPGKSVTALSYLASIKVFLWDSDTNAASRAELDLWCNQGPWCLPATHPFSISVTMLLPWTLGHQTFLPTCSTCT